MSGGLLSRRYGDSGRVARASLDIERLLQEYHGGDLVKNATRPTLRTSGGAQRTVGGDGAQAFVDKTHRGGRGRREVVGRSEEHTSELQSLLRNSYSVFCL